MSVRTVFFLSLAGMGYLTVRPTTTLSLGSGVRTATGILAAEYLRFVHLSIYIHTCVYLGRRGRMVIFLWLWKCGFVCVYLSIKSCEKTQMSLFKWLKCWLMTEHLWKTNKETLSHLSQPCSFVFAFSYRTSHPIFPFLIVFLSISYHHSVPISSLVPSALLLSAIFLSPFLFSFLPICSPGWRKALPPQLCQVCPLSDDVPGRRRNVPNRWGEKRRGEVFLVFLIDVCGLTKVLLHLKLTGIKIDL